MRTGVSRRSWRVPALAGIAAISLGPPGVEAQQVLHLACGDHGRRRGREPDEDRVGQEPDEYTSAQQAEQQLHGTDQ